MWSSPASRLALVGLAAALATTACGRRPAPASRPPAQTVRVDVVALAREHPLFPQLGRLEYLADRLEAGELPLNEATDLGRAPAWAATGGPSGAEKREAKPRPRGSKGTAPGGAAPGEAGGATSILPAEVQAELTAIRQQAAADAREWAQATQSAGQPPPPKASAAAPRSDAVARRQAAADLRAQARHLAAIIREETALACRQVAAEHELRLRLGSPQGPQGGPAPPDQTEAFRGWLRAHWQP